MQDCGHAPWRETLNYSLSAAPPSDNKKPFIAASTLDRACATCSDFDIGNKKAAKATLAEQAPERSAIQRMVLGWWPHDCGR
jgi:hypothetical protein